MREQDVAIDPGLGVGRQQGRFQLASRQRHALVCAIEPVAVDLDVVKLVVGAYFLQLGIGVHQRLPVPEPDIVNRGLVGLESLESEVLFGGKWFCADLAEIVGLPGEGDVVLDVWLLALQLVGLDHQALE